MRLCGHDRVVSGRYDAGSAGSGRYFYRLDPQDPLNFGRSCISRDLCADTPDALAQWWSTGWGSGVYLVSTKRGNRTPPVNPSGYH